MTSSHPTVVSRTASIRSVSISRSATPLSGTTSSRSRLSSAKEAEYQEEIARLRAENEEMRWQRDTAQSHAVMLRRDYNLLKEQLNTKAAQASRKTRGVRQHGLMTSAESRKRIAEEEEKRAAKRRKVEAGKQRRQEKAAVVQAQRNAMDGTEVYKGRLTSKNKTELENIALALGFTADDLKTTKNDLISRITKHLEDNPVLEDDARFSGLYPSRSRQSNANAVAGPSRQAPTTLTSTPQCSTVQSAPVPVQNPAYLDCHHSPVGTGQDSPATWDFRGPVVGGHWDHGSRSYHFVHHSS
ncbi:hypothetical protein EDD15DRAFT_2561393 [Pisolithus albus]|nr:hypothetical protein EDD15DRAFT_2561393 [Pisolithus albus]